MNARLKAWWKDRQMNIGLRMMAIGDWLTGRGLDLFERGYAESWDETTDAEELMFGDPREDAAIWERYNQRQVAIIAEEYGLVPPGGAQ